MKTKQKPTKIPKVTGEKLLQALTQPEPKKEGPANIDDVLVKRKKLSEVHAALSVYLGMGLSTEATIEINTLQERLEFRITQFEAQLLDEKIDIFTKALAIARKDKNV